MVEFRYPYILFAYLIMLAIFLYLSFFKNRKVLFQSTNIKLKNILLKRIDYNKVKIKQRLIFLSLILIIFAASGPMIGTRLAPIERKGIDLVFALDVSKSMNAEDVKPNRLQKAKFEISQIINQLKGDRVGIIVFAGSSHLYLPLTTDYDAARLFLDKIDTNMIPTQGTALSSALQTGINSFIEDEVKYKVLVLITDGEDHEGRAVDIAKEAGSKGMIIHSVAVGTRAGSLIPIDADNGKREYKRDSNGKLVTSVINEEILKDISNAGNGTYIRFENNPGNFIDLLAAIESMDKRKINAEIFSEYQDYYQLFASLSLFFFLIGQLMGNKNSKEKEWRGRFVE